MPVAPKMTTFTERESNLTSFRVIDFRSARRLHDAPVHSDHQRGGATSHVVGSRFRRGRGRYSPRSPASLTVEPRIGGEPSNGPSGRSAAAARRPTAPDSV